MCSDFSRKSMICAWSKVPTRSGGNCMDQDLTWNWWTLRDSANVHRYTTITDPNNHPPHININRLVWKPKLWQSHVNYRFEVVEWCHTGRSASVRKDWRKHCASPTQDVLHPLRWGPGVYKAITNYKQENKQSMYASITIINGLGTQPKYYACPMYPSHDIQMLWTARLKVLLLLCPHCSSRMFTIWLRSFSSLLVATIIGRINASTMFHRILHCYFHLWTENKGFVEKNFIDVVFMS